MFNGNLITVGAYNIPLKYISAETYSAYINVQDMDSYRDANGLLHRNVVSHAPIKVEFETMPLTSTQWAEMMAGIKNNYSVATERKASIVAFIPETDEYITQDVYLVQPQPKIDVINAKTKTIYYKPIKISFVGY